MLDRTKFIGGSDLAGILGMSRWSTPLKVWAEKTQRLEPKDISDKEAVKVGIYLEEYIAKRFCEETGKTVRRVNDTIFHKDYDFLAANIDRRVVAEDTILECKTATAYKAKEWDGEEIPQEYILQCLHYLAITGAEKCYLAVLIGNQSFKIKEIYRNENENLIKTIITKEVSFWNNFVIPKIQPAIILRQDDETLFNLYPEAEDKEIVLDDTANQIIESIEALKLDKKSLEASIEMQENELKSLLKDSERGRTTLYIVSWKNQTTKRLDTKLLKEKIPEIYTQYAKETQSRILRIKEIGE